MAPFYKQSSHLPLSCLVALTQTLQRSSSPQGALGSIASSPHPMLAVGPRLSPLCSSLGAPAWLSRANTLPIQSSHSKAVNFSAPSQLKGKAGVATDVNYHQC